MSELATRPEQRQIPLPPNQELLSGQPLGQTYYEAFLAESVYNATGYIPDAHDPHSSVSSLLLQEIGQKLPIEQQTQLVGDAETKAADAREHSWWNTLPDSLVAHHVDRRQAYHVKLQAKHTMEAVVNGQPTGQGFEMYEVGSSDADTDAVETVGSTLQLADQLTGGLLASDPNRPKIVLATGMNMEYENQDGNKMATFGYATPEAIVLNLDSIKKGADKEGISPRELLAAITVHELMGHGLERLMKNDTGKYFDQHFEYADEKVDDDNQKNGPGSVTAKDPGAAASKPVMAYGHTNPAEDLATSTQAAVGEAMNWDTLQQDERFRTHPDEYRRELVMALMDAAADKAKQFPGTPGTVSNELVYKTDSNGNTIGVEPTRQYQFSTVMGAEAQREELRAVIDRYKAA